MSVRNRFLRFGCYVHFVMVPLLLTACTSGNPSNGGQAMPPQNFHATFRWVMNGDGDLLSPQAQVARAFVEANSISLSTVSGVSYQGWVNLLKDSGEFRKYPNMFGRGGDTIREIYGTSYRSLKLTPMEWGWRVLSCNYSDGVRQKLETNPTTFEHWGTSVESSVFQLIPNFDVNPTDRGNGGDSRVPPSDIFDGWRISTSNQDLGIGECPSSLDSIPSAIRGSQLGAPETIAPVALSPIPGWPEK